MAGGQTGESGARHQCLVASDAAAAAGQQGQLRFRGQPAWNSQVSELARQVVVPEYQPPVMGDATADSGSEDQPESRFASLPRPALGLRQSEALAVIGHGDAAAELRDEILTQRP